MKNLIFGRDDDVYAVARRLLTWVFLAVCLVVAVVCIVLGVSFSAGAQTVIGADVTPAVDWGLSLLQGVVVPTVLAIVTALLGLLVALLKKKIGLDSVIAVAAADRAQAALNATLHASIQRGADVMEARFRDRLFDDAGKVIVPVKNAGVSMVVERTAALMPDTLAKLGVENATLNRLVREAIDARLNTIEMPDAVVSPILKS